MPTARADGSLLDSSGMDADSTLYEDVRGHYLFAGMDEDTFADLAGDMSPLTLDKGYVLFHGGDRAEWFFYVHSGQVELSMLSPSGEKKTLEVIGPGRTFAEAVTFMQGRKYPVTAEALTDAELCRIPNERYLRVIKSDSDACIRLLADVCRHLHARVREIEHLTIQNARSRLASYLLDHVSERDDDEATIRLELPRHVIASRLSMTPETLSRLLRNLTDEGIVTIEDRLIFVHSLARLRPYD